MASTYTYPESYLAWFIRGNHLAVVTTKGNTAGTSHSLEGQYKPINEAVTNGILIHYYGEPNAVTAITDTPDVDNVFHTSIIDYVKSRLLEDGGDLQRAMYYKGKYEKALNQHPHRKSGVRALAVPRL